jgi:L-alanine-DL-glutamate epimerase-like enolase superfamily enzyme
MVYPIPFYSGRNPCHLLEIDRTMDENLAGHPYVKSAIDIACWDILGKLAKLPLCSLLGGRFRPSVPVYMTFTATADFAERIRKSQAEGYFKFQLKIGGDPEEDAEKIKAAASVLKKGKHTSLNVS